mgnify:CR=1 FL=1
MAFMQKDTVKKYAEMYGIDLTGKTWAEQNQVVRERLEEEGYTVDKNGEVHKPPKTKEVKYNIPNKTVILAPEIKATSVQLIKYDEELGDDLTVEEVSFKDEFGMKPIERDLNYGTYKVKGSSGRKVIAQSTIPKENAGVTYNPARDLVPRVTYDGKTGYIYTHQSYPNIKQLLMDCGQYPKYKHLFSAKEHPENIWYAAGKLLVCSIPMVHYIFDEIEREANAGN